MTHLTQLMRETAAVLRKRNLHKVENLLADPKALQDLHINRHGQTLLEDLRKFTAKGLENEVREMERDLKAKTLRTAKYGRFDPPSPALIALAERRKQSLHKASY